jgi:hypothetical protein
LLSSIKGESSVPRMSKLPMIDIMKRAEFEIEVILVFARINLWVLVLFINFLTAGQF